MITQLYRRVRQFFDPIPPTPPVPPPLPPNDRFDRNEINANLFQAMRREALPHVNEGLEWIRTTRRGPR